MSDEDILAGQPEALRRFVVNMLDILIHNLRKVT
jgi:hypothetical protein